MFKRLLEFFRKFGTKGDAESPDVAVPEKKRLRRRKKAADSGEVPKRKKRKKKVVDGEEGSPEKRPGKRKKPLDEAGAPRKKRKRKPSETAEAVPRKKRKKKPADPESADDSLKKVRKKRPVKKAVKAAAADTADVLPDIPDLPDDDALLKKKKPAAKKKKVRKAKPGTVPEDMDFKVVKGKKKKKKKLPEPGTVPEDMDIKVAKGKKKKKKKAPPPDASLSEDSEFNVSFKGANGQHSDRKAYRVHPKGMSVKLKGVDVPCPLQDLSVTGVGFELKKPKLKRGNVIAFEILDKKGKSLGMVKAEVMRHFEGLVGCCFKNPDSALEDKLHKIVLDTQKKPEGKSKDVSMNLDL